MPDARLHIVRAVSRAARRACVRIARAVLPATLALLANLGAIDYDGATVALPRV